MTERPPRWRRRREARPEEILSAALGLFRAKGIAGTRMDEIAEAAGVAKGTLYRYFPAKDALFRALLERGLGVDLAAAERLVTEHPGPAERTLVALLGFLAALLGAPENAALARLALGGDPRFPEAAALYLAQVVEPARRLVRRVLERGMEAGRFQRLPGAAAAELLLAPLLWGQVRRQADPNPGTPDADALVELHAELFLRALRG